MKKNVDVGERMEGKIDFVITWVDGNDSKWLSEKKKFNSNFNNSDTQCRYRDMGTLKYWFRAIEKYTPWVNKIYFITYGHLPDWLNVNNEKLIIVKHKDYIPEEYLPTYNSNAIELNLFRIEKLSENFVLFNDDFFILKNMNKEEFFKDNLPCEEYAENINMPRGYLENFSHTLLNNIGIVNKHFNKRMVMKKHFFKYINLKYGLNNIRTICLLPWRDFSLLYDPHLPVSLKKSQIEELWKIEEEALVNTSRNKFRRVTDINQYLVRYFQLLKGEFHPRRHGIGKMFNMNDNIDKMVKAIKKQKYKMICINDSDEKFDFDKRKTRIIDAFEYILPEKSSFEK